MVGVRAHPLPCLPCSPPLVEQRSNPFPTDPPNFRFLTALHSSRLPVPPYPLPHPLESRASHPLSPALRLRASPLPAHRQIVDRASLSHEGARSAGDRRHPPRPVRSCLPSRCPSLAAFANAPSHPKPRAPTSSLSLSSPASRAARAAYLMPELFIPPFAPAVLPSPLPPPTALSLGHLHALPKPPYNPHHPSLATARLSLACSPPNPGASPSIP